ncbi:MAG: type II toxin-antitoxin system VapC family toxin [Sulfurimonas sp.]|uniref:type II toxin-antitoxin system VapC family toxin n=1 Tax=Sulfurimonas sp. TaxID=2022749 RepID=UPI0028CCB384|nr:type II toxin-antitoxin system VapC family toxin [Sulfurimonas sp.]MDT8339340.1 type II toxin-antitoxin system VapC family toxin [Sulfurimonas sp.]
MEKIVLDTNILIEILKGNQDIVQKLEESSFLYAISSISAMELYYGAINKAELFKLQKFISLFEEIELNKSISKVATELIFEYSKSHNLDIPDSLIAATAIDSNLRLYTLNTKDFRYIDGLVLL